MGTPAISTSTELLAAYDSNLRTVAEMQGAESYEREGPLWIARFAGGYLFVTYETLDGASSPELVSAVRARLDADPSITEAEWKTRGHDVTPGLPALLRAAGFVEREPESVMIGAAAGLIDAEPSAGIELRRLTSAADISAALDMQDVVFGGHHAERLLPEILERQSQGDGLEMWGAEADGKFVSAGRIDPIPGTSFAGIWGGATLPEYRGRGIYRALTSARVRSMMAQGVEFIHSDSTEDSRPILERSGLIKVTTTTPWRWNRAAE